MSGKQSELAGKVVGEPGGVLVVYLPPGASYGSAPLGVPTPQQLRTFSFFFN